jgi:serine/threonine-protein kinase
VWALGVVLHELLTGETPFRGETLGAIHAAIVSDPPTPLRERRPDVSPALEAVILRSLQKKAADRYSSIPMLACALLPFAELSKDSVARILRDSNAAMPVDEAPALDGSTDATANAENSARSATVEGWGTEAKRERGKRRFAQVGAGFGVLALLGLGSFALFQRPKEPSPLSSDSARVLGTMPVPAVTPSATDRPAMSPPDLTAAEPAASASEVTPALHPSADVHRRLPPKPPHPAPATSSNKIAVPPPSPLDGRK